MRHHATAFGLHWSSDLPLPLFPPAADAARPADVTVVWHAALADRPGGRTINNGRIFADGIRFAQDGATFDMRDGNRIDWTTAVRPAAPPDALYGTVAALLAAWRGTVPIHGSSVEIDGSAVIVCGPSGAGKSTLAAALVAAGARLVSDDLSVLSANAGGVAVWPGRPAIRLVPSGGLAPGEAKRLHRPSATVDPRAPVPLTTLLVRGDDGLPDGAVARLSLLTRQLYRPRWMAAMPRLADRLGLLGRAAEAISVVILPPAGHDRAVPVERRAEAAIAAVRAVRS
ncbi:hypothetical protein M9980_11480 [Sphingomonas donggukensis]|uniref:HPr kinase/phosphorylase C-terminal domain-containing protein n=1 Tax=Sphingomonas donggukensis TaxID=2949093 RepID=A0ABY4TUN1_9SPHN|nr:hypothetical protein [Sphingomonas donggukensis]URW75162.1 hypothetical protein M9980_11480 [Sphingomonas donggukensis]